MNGLVFIVFKYVCFTEHSVACGLGKAGQKLQCDRVLCVNLLLAQLSFLYNFCMGRGH